MSFELEYTPLEQITEVCTRFTSHSNIDSPDESLPFLHHFTDPPSLEGYLQVWRYTIPCLSSQAASPARTTRPRERHSP